MLLKEMKYSYDDISIVPAIRSIVEHRSECNPYTGKFGESNLPIFTAPMSTVVNEKNFTLFEENNIIPILPRNFDLAIRYDYLKMGKWVALGLQEFEELFINNDWDMELYPDINVLIDIANGHMSKLHDLIYDAKTKYHWSYRFKIMAGNIANPLTYYELVRYKADNDIEYWKVDTKEHLSLPLDLLSGDTGKKLCDNLLYDFVKNSIKEDAYNNIILSGLGFNEASSYREFMTHVCSISRVDTDIFFFAKAAALLANDYLTDNFDKNVILMSDARTTVSISIYARVDKKDTKLEIIKPGMEWFSIFNYSFNVIVEDTRSIKFEYLKVIEGVIKEFTINIPDNYKLRSDKSNQFEISFTFIQQNVMDVSIADVGFGEFYEASHERITKDNIYL